VQKQVCASSSTVAPRLQMRGIRKSFGTVTVLRDVSLTCEAGEVHVVCGENGAGKSTLMKVLAGIHAPDAGQVLIDGREARFAYPGEARDAGVAIIHQELALLSHRSVAENIFLGREPARRGVVDRAALREAALTVLARIGCTLDPDAPCADLSVAEQQMVEIAKAVSLEARILVLDEPTAALDEHESEKLFALIAQLRREGVGLLYISHRMGELLRLADNISVMKDGQLMATLPVAEATMESIVRLMVGRELRDFYPPAAARPPGEEVLALTGCGNAQLHGIRLSLHAGEIVGVAGLEASGKLDLARAIAGEAPFTQGSVRSWDGGGAARSPREAARRGIGYVPEDRKREGLGLRQSLRDNAALTLRALAAPLAGAGAADRATRRLDQWLQKVDVRAATFELPVGSLSGGNQQKVLLARWLARSPRVWVVCEPTRGVDVGAKSAIYRLLREFADGGGAVLMVSSDVQEIIGLSDRICVMALGRTVAELPRGSSEEAIIAQAVRHDVPAAQELVA
jgi:ribose transport system ATP-binding protein